MRLDNFVNERAPVTDSIFDDDDADSAKEALKMRFEMIVLKLRKECSEIIREYKKRRICLYRGYKSQSLYLEKTPRSDRRPMDMPGKAHERFDDEFKKEFGWKARSEGTFVTASYSKSKGYGDPYVFFPVNNYEYIYNPEVHDLYIEYRGDDTLRMLNNDYRNEKIEEKWNSEYMSPLTLEGGSWSTEDVVFNEIFFKDFNKNRSNYNDIVNHMEKLFSTVRYTLNYTRLLISYYNNENNKDKKNIYFEWFPTIEQEDYFDDRVQEIDNEVDREIEGYISSYKDYGLFDNIHSLDDQEIIFKCSKFYIVRFNEIEKMFESLGIFLDKL